MLDNNELEWTFWAIANKMRSNMDVADIRIMCWVDLPQICS